MRGISSVRRVTACLASLLPLLLGACASGTGHVEKLADSLNIFDVAAAGAVLGGVFYLTNDPDQGWDASATRKGAGLYHITVARERWNGSGEGDFGRRFRRTAESQCGEYAILSYTESYEPLLIGSRRVAEGTIVCR